MTQDVLAARIDGLVQAMSLNLLNAQDKAIERARASAGDLAYALKTPLTVLGADAVCCARGERDCPLSAFLRPFRGF